MNKIKYKNNIKLNINTILKLRRSVCINIYMHEVRRKYGKLKKKESTRRIVKDDT